MLRAWRERLHITQREASIRFNVGDDQISVWESGGRRPGRRHAVSLRDIADIPIEAWDEEGDTERKRAAG